MMNIAEDKGDQKPVKIFICGAHSTGKTTLAQEISKQTGFYVVPEVARSIIKKKFQKREDYDPKTNPGNFTDLQEWIIEAQAEEESTLDKLGHSYICDRAIDPIVYTLVYVDKQQADRLLNKQETKQNIQRYQSSLVFLLKPYPECMKDDGVRLSPLMEELNLYTFTMEQLLQDLKIPYTIIDALEMEKRVQIVAQQLEVFLKTNT